MSIVIEFKNYIELFKCFLIITKEATWMLCLKLCEIRWTKYI